MANVNSPGFCFVLCFLFLALLKQRGSLMPFKREKKWLPAPSLACAGHNSNSVKLSGDSGHELTSPQFKPERKGSLLKCKYQSLALASILSQKGTGMYFA